MQPCPKCDRISPSVVRNWGFVTEIEDLSCTTTPSLGNAESRLRAELKLELQKSKAFREVLIRRTEDVEAQAQSTHGECDAAAEEVEMQYKKVCFTIFSSPISNFD